MEAFNYSSVAEQIMHWLNPDVSDKVEQGVQTHLINIPNNYTFDDLEGIIET